MPIGQGIFGDLLKARFPIAGRIIETLGPDVVRAIQNNPEPDKLAPVLEDIAKRQPEVKNNLNLEGPLQSGTTLGMLAALLGALGAIWTMLKSGNLDPAILGPLMATVLGSLFGLWRRWAPNLPPLFSKR